MWQNPANFNKTPPPEALIPLVGSNTDLFESFRVVRVRIKRRKLIIRCTWRWIHFNLAVVLLLNSITMFYSTSAALRGLPEQFTSNYVFGTTCLEPLLWPIYILLEPLIRHVRMSGSPTCRKRGPRSWHKRGPWSWHKSGPRSVHKSGPRLDMTQKRS